MKVKFLRLTLLTLIGVVLTANLLVAIRPQLAAKSTPKAPSPALTHPQRPTQAEDTLVSAVIDPSASRQPIPSSFLGLAFEHGSILKFAGSSANAINPAFIQLLKNIGTKGPAVIRIGGNSSDQNWWNPNKAKRPPGITYDTTETDFAVLTSILEKTGSSLIYGLNLGQNDPEMAVDLAKAAIQHLPSDRLKLFEIGNEPDLFVRHFSHKGAAGNRIYMRPTGYAFEDYFAEFTRYARALKNVPSSPPLAAPSVSGDKWADEIPALVNSQGAAIGAITFHRYVGAVCGMRPGDVNYPTPDRLLKDGATAGLVKRSLPLMEAAKQSGKPVLITEINSIACGGAKNVSDSFASALWGTDILFNMLKLGVQGMQFQMGGYYSPFYTNSETGAVKVSPLYYGMMLFAQATAGDTALLPVESRSHNNVKVWATIDARKDIVRIVVINKDENADGNVVLKVPGIVADGSLIRLEADGAAALQGVTLAGQTFDNTSDGKPVGRVVNVKVTPTNGVYTFSLKPTSAALLTISP